jgi:hypothetical protein
MLAVLAMPEFKLGNKFIAYNDTEQYHNCNNSHYGIPNNT